MEECNTVELLIVLDKNKERLVLVLYSVWLILRRNKNGQNKRCWSSENPHAVCELSFTLS